MAKLVPFIATTSEQAEALRATLANLLGAGETINLYFGEAGIVPTSIMNIAVASLLTEFSSETLNSHLFLHGLTDQHKYALVKAIGFQKEMLARG